MSFKSTTWVLLRISMGFIFLWAFADKLLGLGYSTADGNGWIDGGSPTSGFLSNSVRGPFAEFFGSLAGMAVVDWVFMAGLLGVGLTLAFNKYVTWGAAAGALMMALMYLAAFPPTSNPFIDSHIIYILVLALLAIRAKDRY